MKKILMLLALTAGCASEGQPGNIGEPGPQGEPGLDGERGPAGPQGPAGASGADGIDGIDGADGETGPQGVAGDQGPQGPQGPEGPAGPEGIPGTDGADARGVVTRDANGTVIGHPMMIDRGALTSGTSVAVFARQNNPAADFPQEMLISASPPSMLFFSGANCTGTAFMPSSNLSPTYGKAVGYVLDGSNQLFFPKTGAILAAGVGVSFRSSLLMPCANGASGATVVEMVKSDKVFTPNLPWSVSTSL